MIVAGYCMDLYFVSETKCLWISQTYEDFPGGNKFEALHAKQETFTGQTDGQCRKAARRHGGVLKGGALIVETLERRMTASPGDWIIQGVQGEFYPYKPDIFAATYELVTANGVYQELCNT